MEKMMNLALFGQRMAESGRLVTQHSVVAMKPVYQPVGSIATHADSLGHLGHWGISEGLRHSTLNLDAGGGLCRPWASQLDNEPTTRLQREAHHAG